MKVDWETTLTQTETGSLDNDVTDLETAGKDKCETVWCRDWGKNRNEGYKTFQDKVSNYKHDKKLFGYLKFKFKTCQPCLELTLFR